eukprot:gene20420-biopygen5582
MPAPRPRHPKPKIAYSPRHARAMPAPRPRHCPVPPGRASCAHFCHFGGKCSGNGISVNGWEASGNVPADAYAAISCRRAGVWDSCTSWLARCGGARWIAIRHMAACCHVPSVLSRGMCGSFGESQPTSSSCPLPPPPSAVGECSSLCTTRSNQVLLGHGEKQ